MKKVALELNVEEPEIFREMDGNRRRWCEPRNPGRKGWGGGSSHAGGWVICIVFQAVFLRS
jgi:hypothetical protein